MSVSVDAVTDVDSSYAVGWEKQELATEVLFFGIYFAYRLHVETGNPSIHSLLQTPHSCFCRKVTANPDCKFSVACLCRKGQGTSLGWLLSHVPHDVVAIDLSKIAQNLNMYKFLHTFIYRAVISAFEFLLHSKRGRKGIALLEVKCEGCRYSSPLNLRIPRTWTKWMLSLS